MYIIIRAYNYEDKRLKNTGQFWHYGIFQVEPGAENEIRANLNKYNHAVEIPDNLAQADRYLHADEDHALAIKPVDGGFPPKYEDLISASYIHDSPDRPLKKQIYYLTDQNKKDARDLLAIILKAHIRKWTRIGEETDAVNLRNQIDATSDLLELKKLMAIYFDVCLHWSREHLDSQRVHKVDYKYHPDHKLADNV